MHLSSDASQAHRCLMHYLFRFLLYCFKEGGTGTIISMYSVATQDSEKPSDLPNSTQSLSGSTKLRIHHFPHLSLCTQSQAVRNLVGEGKENNRKKGSEKGGTSHLVITFYSKEQ